MAANDIIFYRPIVCGEKEYYGLGDVIEIGVKYLREGMIRDAAGIYWLFGYEVRLTPRYRPISIVFDEGVSRIMDTSNGGTIKQHYKHDTDIFSIIIPEVHIKTHTTLASRTEMPEGDQINEYFRLANTSNGNISIDYLTEYITYWSQCRLMTNPIRHNINPLERSDVELIFNRSQIDPMPAIESGRFNVGNFNWTAARFNQFLICCSDEIVAFNSTEGVRTIGGLIQNMSDAIDDPEWYESYGMSNAITRHGTGDFTVKYQSNFTNVPSVQLTVVAPTAAERGFPCITSVSEYAYTGCRFQLYEADGKTALDLTSATSGVHITLMGV